jgi:hypothetical protein
VWADGLVAAIVAARGQIADSKASCTSTLTVRWLRQQTV